MGALNITYDFQAGFDLASVAAPTREQLIQAITQLAPLSNLGGIVVFSSRGGLDWPGITANPRLQRYIWMDTYYTPSKLKVHDKSGNDGIANWVEVSGSGGGGITINEITSAWTLPAAAPWNLSVAHTIGSVPKLIRPVLLCISGDAGYVLNDEIDFYTGYFISGVSGFPVANIIATTTTVDVIFAADYTERRVFHKTTGVVTTIDNTKWKVKFYLTA